MPMRAMEEIRAQHETALGAVLAWVLSTRRVGSCWQRASAGRASPTLLAARSPRLALSGRHSTRRRMHGSRAARQMRSCWRSRRLWGCRLSCVPRRRLLSCAEGGACPAPRALLLVLLLPPLLLGLVPVLVLLLELVRRVLLLVLLLVLVLLPQLSLPQIPQTLP